MAARLRKLPEKAGQRIGSGIERRGRRPSERAFSKGESGQSVLEFILVVPALLVFIVMLVRVNTAIQVSIVNQKYARAQALFLTYNSPYYPELRFRERMINLKSNQLILGVSNQIVRGEAVQPEPIIYKITRPGAPTGNDTDPVADKRGKVRIRSSVALCTQLNVVKVGGQDVEYKAANLSDEVQFPFCQGYLKDE